jgi:carboxymethylenebutenolidase
VRVTIDGPGPLEGHLAVPADAAGGRVPGVVVLHEAFGLTPDIVTLTDRLAARGYVALAPDLFSWGATARCLATAFVGMLTGRGRTIEDVDGARRHLVARPDCTGRVGVIGFCLGGGFALLAAGRGYDVAAPNYGQLPRHLAEVLRGACPIVASYGGRDVGLRGAAGRLAATLTGLDVPHDVKEYPEAGHSFMNRHTGWFAHLDRVPGVGYRGDDAADAWHRIDAFFDQHLRGG